MTKNVLILRTCAKDGTSYGGFRWPLTIGAEVVAPDYSTLTGGDRGTLTGGDYSTLTGGDRSTLTGGDYSTLTGGDGAYLCWVFWRDGKRQLRQGIVGDGLLLAGVAYRLNYKDEIEAAERGE